MHMMKRGLIALSVMAAVGGTTVGLLASEASASPTRGSLVVHATQYYVGGGTGVGPFSEHGRVVHNSGNLTDVPSLTTDPANSDRVMLVDPTGSFTVVSTGGVSGKFHLNPVSCAFWINTNGIKSTIVSGTGAYAKATGAFKVSAHAQGTLSRTSTGACNTADTAPSAFETDSVVAVGHINLHGAPMVTPHT
jgi:hypothetical protein